MGIQTEIEGEEGIPEKDEETIHPPYKKGNCKPSFLYPAEIFLYPASNFLYLAEPFGGNFLYQAERSAQNFLQGFLIGRGGFMLHERVIQKKYHSRMRRN